MGERIYAYDTIGDAEKAIRDASIQADIIYTSNYSLLTAAERFVNCIAFLATVLSFISIAFKYNSNIFNWKNLFFFLIAYLIFLIIMSYVKFCFNDAYGKAKRNLVDNIIRSCKDWMEKSIPEWQRKTMLRRFADIAGLDVEFKSDKNNQ